MSPEWNGCNDLGVQACNCGAADMSPLWISNEGAAIRSSCPGRSHESYKGYDILTSWRKC